MAISAVAGTVSRAQDQQVPPPPAADAGLPSNIAPGSPLADVVRMIQAGVDAATVQSYILNSQSAFNLDADKILFLKDIGASSDLINAMMNRDKALYASTVTPPSAPVPPPTPPPVDTSVPPPPVDTGAPPDMAPPADVTVNYFYDTLTPFGTWVNVDGYGRCWRPTVVLYDSGWNPYGDRGHWVYTDYGWYWDSDYSWGVAFHYGRWFRDARFGWCWYPDTVWAPSWVAWRSGGDYCGWAPLPPFAEFRPGIGFFYRGVRVGVDFDFGLAANCFMFVSPDHFCDRHPRSFFVPRERVNAVFHQTAVINHFDANGKTFVNRGFGPDRITAVTHRTIEPVHVGSLPNASRQGWRGEGFDRAGHTSVDNHNPPGGNIHGQNFTTANRVGANDQAHQGYQVHGSPGPAADTIRHENIVQPGPGQAGGRPVAQSQWQQPQPQARQNSTYIEPGHYVPPAPVQPQPQQPRQYGTLTEPSHAVQPNQSQPYSWHQQQQPQPQPRQFNSPPEPNRAPPQNQWQQPAAQNEQPRPDVHQSQGEPARNYNPPPSQGSQPSQPQPRNSGNNNNGNNGNNGQNKQNH